MATKSESIPHAREMFDQDELFALARLDIEKGNIAEALGRLKKVTGGQNVPLGAFTVCGQLYARLGLWDHALKMFQKHMERHPEALGEKFSIGLAHANSGRAAEAMKIWSDVLGKQPRYIPALFYRALVRAQQGELAAAKQDLETLVRSADVADPYLKPGKELLQSVDHQASIQAASPAGPAAPQAYAALAHKAYASGTTQ